MPRRDFGFWSLQNRRSVYLVEWLVRASPEEIFLDMGITNLKVSQKGDWWWLGWGFSGGRTWAGHVHRSTHDWWLTWGQMQKNRRKTKFRNQKKRRTSSNNECGKKNKSSIPTLLVDFLAKRARVSRFFFPWDDLPVCAHPEKITQRPRSFFFFHLLIIIPSSSSSQSLFFDARPWEFITFIVCTHSAARCKLFYGHLNWLFRPPFIHITCKLIPLSVAGREWDVGWRKTHECVKDMPLMHISGERYFFQLFFQGMY